VTPTPAPAGPLTVSRAEIDAAVSDFDKLGRDIDARLGADGVTVARVAPGSLFARLGLRAGDRVTAVDGRSIRSLDDAAVLYARLSTATKVSVDVARGTGKVTLRLQVTK
jgi:S1-C subfamily serine protease